MLVGWEDCKREEGIRCEIILVHVGEEVIFSVLLNDGREGCTGVGRYGHTTRCTCCRIWGREWIILTTRVHPISPMFTPDGCTLG